MYDTGQALLPGLKSIAVVPPESTGTRSAMPVDENGTDGTFSTRLSAARARLAEKADGEKHAVDDTRSQGSVDALDEPQSAADNGDTRRLGFGDARDASQVSAEAEDAEKAEGNSIRQNALEAEGDVAALDESELVRMATQAEDGATVTRHSGLETALPKGLADQHSTVQYEEALVTSRADGHSTRVLHDGTDQTVDTMRLAAPAQRAIESHAEPVGGLLSAREGSTPLGSDNSNPQPLVDIEGGESPGRIDPDLASRTRVDDTKVGSVRALPESDGVKAGVIMAGLYPMKASSADARLHPDGIQHGKATEDATLIQRPVYSASQLGRPHVPDADGKAIVQGSTASLVGDSKLQAEVQNTAADESGESVQVLVNLKRAAMLSSEAERNAVVIKSEHAGHSIQAEGAKPGLNVEEMLFQRGLSVQQTSGASSLINADPVLQQSNSSLNMFHTFSSGILTAPVTGRGLSEAGMMMTAPTTVSLLSANAGNDIAGNIRWMRSEGVKSAVINVSPSGMGPISVRIGIEDETMNVSFVALQGATRDALDSALPRLREQLLAQGNESVRVDVSDGKSGQNRSGAEGQLAENRQNQSGDNGTYSAGNREQLYGEQTANLDELNAFPDDKLSGSHSGEQVVRYDLYV